MNFGRIVVLILSCSLFLTGCWDRRELQDTVFVAAIGIDYKDGQYLVSSQLINFGNVAKRGGTGKNAGESTWIGTASGSNPFIAFQNLNQMTSQQQLYLGQVSALVLTSRAIEQDVEDILEALYRYRELRYTAWLFGTEESITPLFGSDALLGLSPELTVIHNPRPAAAKVARTRPVSVRQFLKAYREPGETAFIPSLSLNNKWETKEKPMPVAYIDGLYAFYQKKYKKKFLLSDVEGIRWMNKPSDEVMLQVNGPQFQATCMVRSSHRSVKWTYAKGQLQYILDLKIKASMEMGNGQFSKEELRAAVDKTIRNEIMETFQLGKNSNADLLNLGKEMYKYDLRQWREIYHSPEVKPALKVNIHLFLEHSGTYKAG
ncbi:Ger(x)C family spore germination protein [Paenibacillus aceris]|uniref:Ger(X)C family germination protein n=1 Tax=Paenibacillus aceris TaxID=869555 RepID=A0ABS4HWU3_9BACL|nr:Ger(x)C family spore germination protein [Paenibacillus aceris]MBP1963015.1 Ger(x)C family germination protein [Paenibacillus aceris]NHW38438.1 Ger(x)C family spore germination protein [Paenibacillus aceris]